MSEALAMRQGLAAPPPAGGAGQERLRRWLVDRAAGSRLLDAILRRRARDICAKSGLLDHVSPHGLCLDIGCGLGHILERIALHRPAIRCLGIDPRWSASPPLAARLGRLGSDRIRFCRGDGRALPLADASASTILAAFVLHHLCPTDQEAVLAEAAHVIRPGGTLIVLEDTPGSPAERHLVEAADRRLNFEARGELHAYRTLDAWHGCLQRIGFEVRSTVPFTRVFPPASGRPVPHHALVCTPAAAEGRRAQNSRQVHP